MVAIQIRNTVLFVCRLLWKVIRGAEGFPTTVSGSGKVRNKSFQQDSLTVFSVTKRSHKNTKQRLCVYGTTQYRGTGIG
jgi:hypothetical protein